MKKLNQILVVLMLAVFALPLLNSCKKGEGDPFLSLKSRAARLKGEWTLASGTETGTWGTNTYTITFTGSMATFTMSGNSQTYMYTEVIEFLKDNEFKSTTNEDGDIVTTEGYWAFMDGYEEYADKEMLVIRLKQQTTANGAQMWTGDEMPMFILRFNKLGSSESIIDSDGTSISGGNTNTFKTSKTYTKK